MAARVNTRKGQPVSKQSFANAHGEPAADYVAPDKLVVFTVQSVNDEPHQAGSTAVYTYSVITNDKIEYKIMSTQQYEVGKSYLSYTNTAKTLLADSTELEERPALPILENLQIKVERVQPLHNTTTHGPINIVKGTVIYPEEVEGKVMGVLTFESPHVGTEENPNVFSLEKFAFAEAVPKSPVKNKRPFEPLYEAYRVCDHDIAVAYGQVIGIDIRTEAQTPGTILNKARAHDGVQKAALATRQAKPQKDIWQPA